VLPAHAAPAQARRLRVLRRLDLVLTRRDPHDAAGGAARGRARRAHGGDMMPMRACGACMIRIPMH
jgi:hypothetical protein